jgi:hypothetical protein
MIGPVCQVWVVNFYLAKYLSYHVTHARLAKLQIFPGDNCSKLTDVACALQTSYVNVYFFLVKCLLVYYLSIVIMMIYVWHRTVRSSFCLSSIYIIILIIFSSDLILYDHICLLGLLVCFSLFVMFVLLEALMPHYVDDPLSLLCGYNVSSDDLYEFLENDTSKRARFYRWTNKIKQQWNIKEEKLIITAIVGGITSIVVTIVTVYSFSSVPSETN